MKHWLQHGLSLEELLDVVYHLLILNIFFDFLFSEDPLTNFEFMLVHEAILLLVASFLIKAKENFNRISNAEVVCMAVYSLLSYVKCTRNVFRKFKRKRNTILSIL